MKLLVNLKELTSPRLYNAKIIAYEKKYAIRFEKAALIIYKKFISDLKKYGLQTAQTNLRDQLINNKLATILQDVYSKLGLEGAMFTFNQLNAAKGAMSVKAGGFG